MAVGCVITNINKGVVVGTWSAIKQAAGSTGGLPFDGPYYVNKSVQTRGTQGGTSTIIIEGSNAPTATGPYGTLTSASGAALSFTAVQRPLQIRENPRWIRPRLSTASGTTNLTVEIVAQGPIG